MEYVVYVSLDFFNFIQKLGIIQRAQLLQPTLFLLL